MDKTPVMPRTRLSCRRTNLAGTSTENEPKENTNPLSSALLLDTRMLTDFENDESPTHIACTQEGSENVDVVWDWNSPQPARKPKRSQKRLILHSPKIPLKRFPSNNQVQDFEKLREELQALKEDLALPDNEDSLVLSPIEEADYKDISNVLNDIPPTPVTQDNYLVQNQDDLFNDSVDEQLVLFSQKIESDLNAIGLTNQLSTNNTKYLATTQNFNKKQMCDNNNGMKSKVGEVVKSANELLDTMRQKAVDRTTNIGHDEKNNNHRFSRTSSSHDPYGASRQGNSQKMKFPRTHSFESTLTTFDNSKGTRPAQEAPYKAKENLTDIIPRSTLDEIERKRKEALAKLELKKKQEFGDSIVKCTPQEIEEKRLQAMAKRDAKRKQDIIERNRQEALKRLELSRRKSVMTVRSSVTKTS